MAFAILETKGAIAVLTVNNPKALNALSPAVLQDIDAAIDSIDLDTVRCLIITGAGDKSFVAGADISAMVHMSKADACAYSKMGNDLFLKIEHLPIPVIAAINGFALGGGCELSMSAATSVSALTTLCSVSPKSSWASPPVTAAPSVWLVWCAPASQRN